MGKDPDNSFSNKLLTFTSKKWSWASKYESSLPKGQTGIQGFFPRWRYWIYCYFHLILSHPVSGHHTMHLNRSLGTMKWISLELMKANFSLAVLKLLLCFRLCLKSSPGEINVDCTKVLFICDNTRMLLKIVNSINNTLL